MSEGYSCADIENICEQSAREALSDNLDAITEKLLLSVINKSKPTC
ncbi:hypothetical protein [Helicobacter sp. 13S00401-1]|nr:hypothetical protein [Helicobacter sp. 13S00401-1]